MKFTYKNYIEQHNKAFKSMNESDIDKALELVVNAIRRGAKIVTCGNGGSAFTASHYITDWIKCITLLMANNYEVFH